MVKPKNFNSESKPQIEGMVRQDLIDKGRENVKKSESLEHLESVDPNPPTPLPYCHPPELIMGLMDDPQQPVLSKVYNRQAVTSVGEGEFPLKLAIKANVESEEVTSSENLEKHRIGTKTKVVSGDSNMVVNERDDMEKTLNYENSDLFTVKLELKGNQKVNKRHLLLNPDNIETKEEDIDPSNPHNGRKVTNYSNPFNPFIAEPPVVEAKMGPIISPFQLKINTGKSPNNEGLESKEFSLQISQNA